MPVLVSMALGEDGRLMASGQLGGVSNALDSSNSGARTRRKVGDERTAPIADVAEVLRVATMLQAIREAVEHTELDDSACHRLVDVYRRAVDAISAQLSSDLRAELAQFVIAARDPTPSVAEVRILHSTLTGWLQGLFQGLQAGYVGQQLAKEQLMGRQPSRPTEGQHSGQYL